MYIRRYKVDETTEVPYIRDSDGTVYVLKPIGKVVCDGYGGGRNWYGKYRRAMDAIEVLILKHLLKQKG